MNWRIPIPGLSRYWVRRDGEIESGWYTPARVLVGGFDRDGYRKFTLVGDDGRPRTVRRSRVMCEAFHGPPPGPARLWIAHHRDRNPDNDVPENLCWRRRGLPVFGSRPVGES